MVKTVEIEPEQRELTNPQDKDEAKHDALVAMADMPLVVPQLPNIQI